MLRRLPAIGALALCGCATLFTLSPDRIEGALSAGQSLPRVYSGTIADGYAVTHDRSGQAGFFCLLDLPLSIAADTVVLPWTLVQQIRHGSYRPRCIPEAQEEKRRLFRLDREAALGLCREQRARGFDDCKSMIAADGTVLISLEPPDPLCPERAPGK